MMKLAALIIIALIAIGIISYFINIYNKLIMLKNNVSKSFANIDVLLKQRVDEIPNLVKVVKESTEYEQKTLEKLTQLRTQYLASSDMGEKIKLSNEIGKSLSAIFAVAENYPDLKAVALFGQLQTRVSQLEDNIADRREFYNESVNMYNIGIAEFPNVIFAKILNYKNLEMLQISDKEIKYDGVQF